MDLKEVYCPECGAKVKVDTKKEVNFCAQCGNKIVMKPTKRKVEKTEVKTEKKVEENNNQTVQKVDIEEKLQEIQFYYETSRKKKEGVDRERNPFYYLKAQDALLELSDKYPEDYRIWWELSKPIDFMCEEECGDFEGRYEFNSQYFENAIDKAGIEDKKKLIQQMDQYNQKKARIKQRKEAEEQKKEEERRRIEEKRREEERKKEEARQEEERKKEEARKEEERKKEEARQEEERKKEAKRQLELEEQRKKQQQELERQKDLEQRTYRGYTYNTLEEAGLAKIENEQIDALKTELMSIKKQEKRKELFESKKMELRTQEAQNRYRLLQQKVSAETPKAEKINSIYGITVLIAFIVYMVGIGIVGMNSVIYMCVLWGGCGIWIWAIWKVVLVIKSKKKDYYKNIKDI